MRPMCKVCGCARYRFGRHASALDAQRHRIAVAERNVVSAEANRLAAYARFDAMHRAALAGGMT